MVGLDDNEREREIVKNLINTGVMTVPATEDGRFTNIASINVKGKVFRDKASYDAALATLKQQVANANDEQAKKQAQTDIVLITALNKF